MTKLNARELAAVITGLRLLQETYLSSGDVLPFGLLDVATNGGTLKPFDVTEIDDLAERLNFGDDAQSGATVPVPDVPEDQRVRLVDLARAQHAAVLGDDVEVDDTARVSVLPDGDDDAGCA